MRAAILAATQTGGAVSYSAEATALFARMSVAPDATRKGHIDTLIVALKAAGVWDKMDVLYIHAAHDAQAARLNWKSTSFNSTAVNSPTFTTDRGYAGDGATSYLDSGYNPTTAGGVFAQNSGHMGVWVGTDVNSGTQYDLGYARARLNARNGSTAAGMFNSTALGSFTISPTTSIGHTCWSRALSTEVEASKDGVALTNSATTSAANINLPFYILAYATSGPAPTNYSTRRNQAAHWGSHLTSAERTSTYNAIAAYMTAVGA